MTDGRHAVAEETSLALHTAVAERIRTDPSLVERARRRVEGWLRDGTVARAYADAWREVLERPAGEVARFLEDPGDRARQLRQSSPFAGAWIRTRAGRSGGEPDAGPGRLDPHSARARHPRRGDLEPHDLVVAKYVAGREKDRDYVRAALRHRLVARDTLLERLTGTPIDEAQRARIAAQIAADAG